MFIIKYLYVYGRYSNTKLYVYEWYLNTTYFYMNFISVLNAYWYCIDFISLISRKEVSTNN